MASNNRLDPTLLRTHIEALRHSHPQIANEEELWVLTLESETRLPEFLAAVVDRMCDTDTKIEAIGNRIAALKARSDRFEQRTASLRTLAHKVMDFANVRKVELPIATLSIRAGQPRVIITNENELPDELVRIKREPNKPKIKDYITAGMEVPGASLSNSEETLAVRVK